MHHKKTKIIAIDFGKVRIGLAASDELKIFANALKQLEAKQTLDQTVDAVIAYIKETATQGKFEVEEIIVGLPIHMDGTESDSSRIVRLFAEKLSDRLTVKVTLFDERLTSVQATRSLLDAEMSRKKRKAYTDQVSAALLLQSYLDSRPHVPSRD